MSSKYSVDLPLAYSTICDFSTPNQTYKISYNLSYIKTGSHKINKSYKILIFLVFLRKYPVPERKNIIYRYSQIQLVQHNKKYHMKFLLNSFHFTEDFITLYIRTNSTI